MNIMKYDKYMKIKTLFIAAICSLVSDLLASTSSEGEINGNTFENFVENGLVASYLSDAATKYKSGIGRAGSSLLYYSDDAKNNSYLSKVDKKKNCEPNWAEQPAVTKIAVSGGTSINISESPSFTNTRSFNVTNGYASVDNLVPQTIYWYQVISSNGNVASTGTFKTLGQERMLRVPNILNVRDIGGWPAKDVNGNAGRIAYNKIIRGGTLDGGNSSATIGDAGIQVLCNDAKVLSELDLRGAETQQKESKLGKNASYLRVDMAYYRYAMTNTVFYKSEWDVKTGHYYATIDSCLYFISENLKNGIGTYVHCSIGADRTGTIIAIIQALCGVSDADIVKDWEMTSFSTRWESSPSRMEKIINKPALGFYYETKDGIQRRDGELRSVFDYLAENYSGTLQNQVESWLKAKVFSARKDKGASIIKTIREKLVVSAKTPTLIREWKDGNNNRRYSVIYDNQKDDYMSTNQKIKSDGNGETSDIFSTTGYIDCSDYKKVLLNVNCGVMAIFYNGSMVKIGSIEDANTMDAVIFENKEFNIPAGAKFVKFNVPKDCDWTAVLTNDSLL